MDRLFELIERALSYAKSNLDDFNEAFEEEYTEEDIDSCVDFLKD